MSHLTEPIASASKGKYEFGGPFGTLGIVIFSHFLVYYLWISLTYYQGSLILPLSLADTLPFFGRLINHIYTGAAPTFFALAFYFGFLAFQLLLANFMPGIYVKGLPVPSAGGVQITYLCNGISSWYTTLAAVIVLQITGLFYLSKLADNIGPLITVAVLCADSLSVLVYFITVLRGQQLTPAGNMVYDFFMGVVLNPRIDKVDLKLFSEIRIAWILLFLLTLSAALKQYALLGTLTWPMIFMVVAHALYTNACFKGEEFITTTWDIFHEKWGWMLIYWNFVGVPFVYSFHSFYILKNNPQYPLTYTIGLFVVLFAAYYVWDTAQSQKNSFRMQHRGTYVPRKVFPQLPWHVLKNPCYIVTKNGGSLLIDGWWRYARKIHYTSEAVMVFTWALNCGFSGILPYFYPIFFLIMITHRYRRDSIRCAKKYGKDWEKYCKIVPYKFIPFIY